MGNSLRKRTAKVMKIDGSSFKLKAPAPANDVLKDHPGHVLLESGDVKQLGLRANPLDPAQPLKPRKLYFLVELPKLPVPEKGARRVRSGINMSAKDRLENLKLSRRAVSDLSSFGGAARVVGEEEEEGGGLRVRVRLPRSQVARLVEASRDGTEAAEKIVELCVGDGGKEGNGEGAEQAKSKTVTGSARAKSEKRMRFAPIESQIIG